MDRRPLCRQGCAEQLHLIDGMGRQRSGDVCTVTTTWRAADDTIIKTILGGL
jgi:hypothetical protein